MILVTNKNVTVELLKKVLGGAAGRVQVSEKFLLQTRKGIHTAELRSTNSAYTRFVVRHIANSPYATICKGSHSTYIGGTVSQIANLIKDENYDFFTRRQPQ